MDQLKAEREPLEKGLDIKNYDQMVKELQQIREKLGFGSINVQDEKKLIERKNKIEPLLPKAKYIIYNKES